jgi:hypothetical protein
MSGDSMDSKIDNANKAKMGTVDAVHEHLDGLVLSVFEMVRGHDVAVDAAESEISKNGQQKSALLNAQRTHALDVRIKYNATMASIDALVGIERSQAQQEDILNEQTLRIGSLKQKIIEQEQTLIEKKKSIDLKLQQLLNDKELGLSA